MPRRLTGSRREHSPLAAVSADARCPQNDFDPRHNDGPSTSCSHFSRSGRERNDVGKMWISVYACTLCARAYARIRAHARLLQWVGGLVVNVTVHTGAMGGGLGGPYVCVCVCVYECQKGEGRGQGERERQRQRQRQTETETERESCFYLAKDCPVSCG